MNVVKSNIYELHFAFTTIFWNECIKNWIFWGNYIRIIIIIIIIIIIMENYQYFIYFLKFKTWIKSISLNLFYYMFMFKYLAMNLKFSF
jgi:hypothetical protein